MSARRHEPNPDQPGRCPSMDPYDAGLQCGRAIHEDEECVLGGIAWKKGEPRILFDSEKVETLEKTLAELRDQIAAVEAQRDTYKRRLAKYLHNHITRDVKPRGQCASCDHTHDMAELNALRTLIAADADADEATQ